MEIKKKLNWLTKSELSQDIIDRNQRLLYRKTQFRDQLVHHKNPEVTNNNCEYCQKVLKICIKETALHCLFECPKIREIFDHIITDLGLKNYISHPIIPKQVLIWDDGKDQHSPTNLINAVWVILLNEILIKRDTLEQPVFDNISKKIKGEIIASIGAYPHKRISHEVGRLGLMEFMASQQINS